MSQHEAVLQKNFKPHKFVGKWYLIAKIPNQWQSGCANSTVYYDKITSKGFGSLISGTTNLLTAAVNMTTGTVNRVTSIVNAPAIPAVGAGPIDTISNTTSNAINKTTAVVTENTPLPDIGSATGFSIRDECLNADGSLNRSSRGVAKVFDPKHPAAWQLIYEDLPDTGINYLIHETDYNNYAIAGSPDKTMLFLWARRPHVNAEQHNYMKERSRGFGYNVEALEVDNGTVSGTEYDEARMVNMIWKSV